MKIHDLILPLSILFMILVVGCNANNDSTNASYNSVESNIYPSSVNETESYGMDITESSIESNTSFEPNDTDELIESSSETETTESSISETGELVIPEEYYEVINSIVEYVSNFDPEVLNTYVGMTGISGISEICFYDRPLQRIGYSFVDIDKDGIAELLILSNDDYSQHPRILEVYSFYDEEVHHIFSGWYRNRFYLLRDMKLYNEGSNGASNSVAAWYSLDSNSHQLALVNAFYTLGAIETGLGDEGGVVCSTTDIDSISSIDLDNPSIEIIESFTEPIDFYENYSAKEYEYYDTYIIESLSDYKNSLWRIE